MSSAIEPLVDLGIEAYRDRRYFDAHEHWEDGWRATSEPGPKDALQGLIQLAASLHKAQSDEPVGHAKLWAKAGARLRAAASAYTELWGLVLEPLARATSDPAPGVGAATSPPPLVETSARAARRPRFGVVYLHGFGSSPHGTKGRAIVGALQDAGVPVAAPELAPPTDFFAFTVSRNVQRARVRLFERTLLVGSSLGGWSSALLAQSEPRVAQMVLLCPAFRFAERWHQPDRAEAVKTWRTEGQLDFEVGHPPQLRPLSVAFLDDVLALDGTPPIEVPTTVFHGTQDEVVPLEDARTAVSDAAPVDFRVRDDDHALHTTLPEIIDEVLRRARDLA